MLLSITKNKNNWKMEMCKTIFLLLLLIFIAADGWIVYRYQVYHIKYSNLIAKEKHLKSLIRQKSIQDTWLLKNITKKNL